MDSLFERRLREKISIMMDMRTENLTGAGVMAITSMEEYKYDLGYLKALRDVLATMEEIDE